MWGEAIHEHPFGLIAGPKRAGRPLISEEERKAQAARRNALSQAREAAVGWLPGYGEESGEEQGSPMRLVLIRHGESEHASRGIISELPQRAVAARSLARM
jgi:hypothetical protein